MELAGASHTSDETPDNRTTYDYCAVHQVQCIGYIAKVLDQAIVEDGCEGHGIGSRPDGQHGAGRKQKRIRTVNPASQHPW